MRIALGFFIAVLSVRRLVGNLGDAAGTGPRYREARIETAFGGFPVDSVAAALDARLLPATPLRLGESFRSRGPWDYGFLAQRVAEGLYPRRVTEAAAHSLEIQPSGRAPDALAWLPGGSSIVLRGPPTAVASRMSRVAVETPALAGMLLRLLAVLGLGRLLGLALGARRPPLSPLESLLAGILLVALAVHAAAWLNLALPWTGAVVAGLLGLFVGRRSIAASDPAPPRDWAALALEALLVCCLAAFTARTLFVPVSGWDGRSIWLFHARQLAFAEGLGRALTTPPQIQPTYPLLLPAHLAFFGMSDVFNERSAAASLAVLFVAGVGLCWRSAQRLMQRPPAALFALAVVVGTSDRSAEAYADGFLALLLALQFLSSLQPTTPQLPLMAAAAAALLKREGLPLALLVHLASRGRRGLGSCALAVAPGALHMAWAAWHRLPHDFSRVDAPTSSVEWGERLYWILRIGARKVLLSEFLMFSFVAALLALAALATRRLPCRSLTGKAMVAAAASLALVLLPFLVTAAPLNWHLDTALDRLLMTPAVFALLALVAAEWPDRRGPVG